MSRVLVTGATGFVGRALCELLCQSGYAVRAALRTERPLPDVITESVVVGNIGGGTNWHAALRGVDAVMHLAALAHVMNDAGRNGEAYLETNERGTRRLAEAAGRAGVRRFIFLSSVKVNGESSERAFRADDAPQPQDDYGRSKWLGEQSLTRVGAATGMEWVVVRSPLVYGPRVQANFLRLMHWVDLEIPLPFGAVRNARSLVNVWNLSSFLTHVLASPAARCGTWMVSDGEDLSTPELVRRLALAMRRRPRLLSVPVGLLRVAGVLARKAAEIDRLCGSLTVDIESSRRDMGWSPVMPVDEALARTVRWYRSRA
jgi:nucleoside-diphosphate-sugar epimerase